VVIRDSICHWAAQFPHRYRRHHQYLARRGLRQHWSPNSIDGNLQLPAGDAYTNANADCDADAYAWDTDAYTYADADTNSGCDTNTEADSDTAAAPNTASAPLRS
jgi:hypothetical protein